MVPCRCSGARRTRGGLERGREKGRTVVMQRPGRVQEDERRAGASVRDVVLLIPQGGKNTGRKSISGSEPATNLLGKAGWHQRDMDGLRGASDERDAACASSAGLTTGTRRLA